MSQFTKLFEVIEDKKEQPKDEQKTKSSTKKGSLGSTENHVKPKTKSEPKLVKSSTETKVELEKVAGSKSSRKNGKSSSNDYTQVLTYIKKDTHKQTKKVLIDDPQERDLSDLVEQLLSDWLRKNQ